MPYPLYFLFIDRVHLFDVRIKYDESAKGEYSQQEVYAEVVELKLQRFCELCPVF